MNSYDVHLEPILDRAIINVRCEPGLLAPLEAQLSLTFPRRAHESVAHDRLSVFSLSADQWWIQVPYENETTLHRKLREVTRDVHVAISIVTDHFSGFALKGKHAPSILKQGLSIDLDHYVDGCCTRCGFARCGAVVHVVRQYTHYEVYVESSYSDYIRQWFRVASGSDTTTY